MLPAGEFLSYKYELRYLGRLIKISMKKQIKVKGLLESRPRI